MAEALEGASVVVDVSNSPSFEDAAVLEFFETSTGNLLEAERAAGVGHHVALSVVGSDRSPTSGYFRAKLAQERLITSSPIPYSIVHATQFFEFLARIADSATDGDTVRLPAVLIQPMAADDVASAVGRAAVNPPLNGIVEVAGPEQFRFDELVRNALAARGDPRRVLTDPTAPYFGAQLGERTLVPDADAQLASNLVRRLVQGVDDGCVAGRLRRRTVASAGQRCAESSTRRDVELGEHFVQVVLDRSRTDEQTAADFGIGLAGGREPGDLRLFRGEYVARVDRAFAHCFPGRKQLPTSTFGERGRPHAVEHLVRTAELLTGVDASLLTPQPLPIKEVGATELDVTRVRASRSIASRWSGSAASPRSRGLVSARELRAPSRCPTRQPCRQADRRHPRRDLAVRSLPRPQPVRPAPSWRCQW